MSPYCRSTLMNRRTGGIALLVLAGFMLVGFLKAGAPIGSLSVVAALLIVVGIPAAAGIALLRAGPNRARLETLRQQTIEAEVLRMAAAEGGRLTAVEVAA